MAYEYTNQKGSKYFLHSTVVTLRGGGRRQTIYYFARQARKQAIEAVPQGFKVVENTRTGLPVLKRGRACRPGDSAGGDSHVLMLSPAPAEFMAKRTLACRRISELGGLATTVSLFRSTRTNPR